jgi:hypothetical protein
MPEINEYEIEQLLTRLGAAAPSEASTDRALRRTLAALPSSARPTTFRRLLVPTSIAAALLIAVTVALIALQPPTATAAEALDQLADAIDGYKGWVHTELQIEESRFQQGSFHGGVTAWRSHRNTADGMSISDITRQGVREIRWESPRDNHWMRYNSDAGVIRMGPLDNASAEDLIRAAGTEPTTIAQALRIAKERYGLQELNARTQWDGNRIRYDIVYPPKVQDACLERGCPVPQSQSIWVDPKTHLIQRVRNVSSLGTLVTLVSYGGALREIYALGVPRDTRIEDFRPDPSEELRSWVARLQERRRKFSFDYTAVVGYGTKSGDVRVVSQHGTSWAVYRYLLGESRYRDGSARPAIELPPGWPMPSLQQVLDAVAAHPPIDYTIFDGEHHWDPMMSMMRANISNNIKQRPELAESAIVKRQLTEPITMYHPLSWELWPLPPSDARAEIVRNPDRRGQVGIRWTQVHRNFVSGTEVGEAIGSTIIWYDTNRDDLPVEMTGTHVLNGETEWIKRTTYLDYSKTPTGLWYPTRWHEMFEFPGRDWPTEPREYRLQLFVGVTLDPLWFTDPKERFKNDSR